MAKNTNTGYRVNHIEEEIVITKAFEQKASVQRTREYKILLQLKKENSTYSVVKRTVTVATSSTKVTYKGLDYDRMANYIKSLPDSENNLIKFEKVKEFFPAKGRYAKVKKWFLEKYKDYSDDVLGFENDEDSDVA